MIGFLHFEKRGNDWAAGAMAALGAVKPHLVFLFWIALLIWSVDQRRWKVMLGGILVGLAATLIPVAFNPAVLHQYKSALSHEHPPSNVLSPTLGTILRLLFSSDRQWLHLIPSACGVLWLAFFWHKHRLDWNWAEYLPLVLLASFLTTFYGAFTCDRVILLVPIIQAAVWVALADRLPVTLVALAWFLLIDGLAVALFTLGPSWLTWDRFSPGPPGRRELNYMWMTPVLFISYLVLSQCAGRGPKKLSYHVG
jgi:hypothetical protein